MRTIYARLFIDKDLSEKIIVSKYTFDSLDKKTKKTIQECYKQISELPPPYFVYSQSNKEKDLDTIAREMRELKESFLSKYPFFRLLPIIDVLKRIFSKKNAIFKYEMRKMRESPNVVNILSNNDYLIFIYNRKLIGTQGDLTFVGIPLSLLIFPELGFLDSYIPREATNFEVLKNKSLFGLNNYYIEWDV